MENRTPSKDAILYSLNSILKFKYWEKLEDVLRDSEPFLKKYTPEQGGERYNVLIEEIYSEKGNINLPSASKLELFIIKFRFIFYFLLILIPVATIAAVYNNILLFSINIILALGFMIFRVYLMNKASSKLVSRIRILVENTEEVVLLLEDYRKWLDWKDRNETIRQMKDEYQQKKPTR